MHMLNILSLQLFMVCICERKWYFSGCQNWIFSTSLIDDKLR